jgi:signal transduction histidine kinase
VNEAVGIPNAQASIGQHIDDIFKFTDTNQVSAPLFSSAQQIVEATILDRQFTLNNVARSVAVRFIPFSSVSKAKDDRFMVILHDVSHERTLEQQRSEFISITSHELRTPIAIATSSLALLLSVPGDIASQHSRVETAQEALNHLSEIINELSVLSSAQEGVLDIDIINVDVKQVLKQQIDNHLQIATRKHLELKLDIDPRVKAVLTSERRMSEIVRIYLNNAFRYTEKGSVTISAVHADDGGVTIAVEDTGVGIPSGSQNSIFTKFYQVEDAMSRSVEGGLGLGLYTVKELAIRLNANVWFESKEHVGSKFFLHIPPFSRQAKDTKKVLDASLGDVSQAL